jgi:hypothetical protein
MANPPKGPRRTDRRAFALKNVTPPSELLALLSFLPEDAQLAVGIRKSDLLRAIERRNGGPTTIDTKQAAALLGFTSDRWRRWAEGGLISGAWQDAPRAPWHLPRAACEAHIRALQQRGVRRAAQRATAQPAAADSGVPAR